MEKRAASTVEDKTCIKHKSATLPRLLLESIGRIQNNSIEWKRLCCPKMLKNTRQTKIKCQLARTPQPSLCINVNVLAAIFPCSKPSICNPMKMGSFSWNRRFLKLVHPGGFVEIHKNPITAAEVMKKYPRHFVTRPDVFRFPWIMICPESILKPGNVFFIVPYHTVYGLLQTSLMQQQDHFLPCYDEICPAWAEQEVRWEKSDGLIQFPQEGNSLESSVVIRQDFHLLAEKQSPPASQERAKVDCKFEDEYAIFPKDLDDSNIKQFLEQCPDGQSLGKAHFEVKTQQHFDDSPKKLRSPKHRPVVCDYRNRRNKSSSSFPSQSTLSDAELVVPLSRDDDGALNCSSSQEEKRLKSCLKKNNFTKARNFRVVRFDLLDEDEKKLRPKGPSFNQCSMFSFLFLFFCQKLIKEFLVEKQQHKSMYTNS